MDSDFGIQTSEQASICSNNFLEETCEPEFGARGVRQSRQTARGGSGDEATPEGSTEQRGQLELTRDSDGTLHYNVQKGDNLWRIATELLKHESGQDPSVIDVVNRIGKLARANNITNPDMLHTGTDLRIPEVLVSLGESLPPAPDAPAGAPAVERVSEAPSQPLNRRIEDIYVSQRGDGANWYACGPTSLQMALAARGMSDTSEATRQSLIRETGTTPAIGLPGSAELIARTIRNRGLESAYHPTNSVDALDKELGGGRAAVVNGALLTRGGGNVGHFIYVHGRSADGNYIVGDPAQPGHHRWTRQELSSFMNRPGHPPGFATVGNRRA